MSKQNAGPARRSSGLGAIALVLVTVIGVWLLNGRGPGTSTSAGPIDAPSSSSAPATGVSPTPTPPQSQSPGQSPGQSPSPSDAPTITLDPQSGLPIIDLEALPVEARDTIDLIFVGGPYPYSKDGSTFGNYEGLLPDQGSGYYAEYTVDTPGSSDRGARRVIAGDGGDFYWTDDHYASFSRVRI